MIQTLIDWIVGGYCGAAGVAGLDRRDNSEQPQDAQAYRRPEN
jgi:hypothetical protein